MDIKISKRLLKAGIIATICSYIVTIILSSWLYFCVYSLCIFLYGLGTVATVGLTSF